MSESQIEGFINKASLNALTTLLGTDDEQDITASALLVADAFGGGSHFASIAAVGSGKEEKLISSFHNNLLLLIQKTWVEKSDEDLKAQVLYHLEEFTALLNAKSYPESYPLFFDIVDNVVYLMFGAQTKAKDFDEYALRIDPEFGVFWWYIKSLPRTAAWSAFKTRIAVLLGMYFLANY